jgi:hypothetical protein
VIEGVGTRGIVGESRWFGLVGGCRRVGKSDGVGRGMCRSRRTSGVLVKPLYRDLMF